MRPDEKFKEFFFHPSFSSLFYYACYEERDTVRFYSLYYFFFIIFLDKNSRQIVRKRIFFFPLIFLYIYICIIPFLFFSFRILYAQEIPLYLIFFFFLHVSFFYSPFFLRFVRSPQYTQARFLLFPLLFFYIYFYVSPRGERYNRDNFKK